MTNPTDALRERLARPQRHRLLQGFPAVPAMVAATEPSPRFLYAPEVRALTGALVDHSFAAAEDRLISGAPSPLVLPAELSDEQRATRQQAYDESLARWELQRAELEARVKEGDRSEPDWLQVDRSRQLLVGVLPHTQCAPSRPACGFCTFPHDSPNTRTRATMVEAVCRDIARVCSQPALTGRRVHAVYLGGGTANLSSPQELQSILSALRKDLVLDEAELTLEGVPAFFDRFFASHLDWLAREPVASRRISLGVQTFDPALLRLMGREKFGTEGSIGRLVRKAQQLGIVTSADLLFDLPGQSLVQMRADVAKAIELGFEQLCLYHLVLYAGLGTPWSEDPRLVASVPSNEQACEHWLTLRAQLLEAGYVQTTLTNFERADVATSPRRFRYEDASFSPDRTDAVGFGPMSLTTFVDWPARRGLKLLRSKNVSGAPWSKDDLAYRYDELGLKALQLTRGLAKGLLELATWRALFGAELTVDLGASLEAVRAEGLVTFGPEALELTPRGMFYADSVVSTLCAELISPKGDGLHTIDLLRERPRTTDYVGMG